VRQLRQDGYGGAFAMTGIGYREVSDYIDGVRTLDTVIEKIKADTHRLARTQDGWFRRDDPRIHWVTPERAFEEASAMIETMIGPGATEATQV
jgi:tRNA dimethylallyltransferase